MTREEMYQELEKLHAQVDWNDRESIHRYNEKAREIRRRFEQEQEEAE